ncbi:MAG: hypothetical protein AAF202_02640 [Pseudomonadota bacterium]
MKFATKSMAVLVFVIGSSPGLAASKFKKSLFTQAPLKKQNQYISDGVVLGGKISEGFTLLKVRRGLSNKSKMERVVLDIGDLVGKPVKNQMAYHHINIDGKRNRLVVELNQVARSGVDQAELKKMFRESPYVGSADIIFDPEDLTTSLILNFKRKTKVEVFNQISPDQPSRIVIDMMMRKPKKSS